MGPTLENRPICAASPFRSWSLHDAQTRASLRIEKRLRPVVSLGRYRVGPLSRNRVVPFRRNQVGPFTRNPAVPRHWTRPSRIGYSPDMVDILTRSQRSALLSTIRGRNTRPELVVRRLAHS